MPGPPAVDHLRSMFKSPMLPRPRKGFTLVEMVAALALITLTVSHLILAARRQLDQMAVLAAREEVVGLFHRAREEAIGRGASEVVLHTAPPMAELISLGDTLDRAGLEGPYRVSLSLSRNRVEARLRFGPLGLGRVASQTLTFRRGGAESRLVVSSLGRVSRP